MDFGIARNGGNAFDFFPFKPSCLYNDLFLQKQNVQ